MIRRPPRSTLDRSSAASDVYKRQVEVYNNVEIEKAELEKSRKEFENSQDLKNKYRSEIDAMRNEIVEVHKQLNTRKSRLDFLAGLVDQDEAVRFLSKDKSWNPNEAVTVSDVISTSDEFRVSIAVALGSASSCLIVNNIDQAMSGVASLKLGKKGKATFICLDRIKENDTSSNKTLPDYVIGYALNLTKSDSKFDSLRRVLLGDVVIAVSYTHLRAHETVLDLVCRLLLEKKNTRYHYAYNSTT